MNKNYNFFKASIFLVFNLIATFNANALIDITNVQCICSGGFGSIDLTVDPDPTMYSAGPFTYEWVGPTGSGYTSAEQDPSDITIPGQYTVTVHNAFGCSVQLYTTITECPPTAPITLEGTTCICAPASPGTIDIAVDETTGPYTFLWEGPNGYSSTMEDPDNIILEGFYYVTATNSNGCETIFSVPVQLCPEVSNMPPYLETVTVLANEAGGGFTPIYKGFWNDQGNCISYDLIPYPFSYTNLSDISIIVQATASEALADLIIDLPGLSPNTTSGNSSSNGHEWSFTFPAGVLSNLSGLPPLSQQILFTGKDLDDLPLLDLKGMSNELTECVSLPGMVNCDTWTGNYQVGTDDVHIFELGCIIANLETVQLPSGSFAVFATVNGTGAPYTVSWIGPDVNYTVTLNYNGTIQLPFNGTPGDYVLKVFNSECSAYENLTVPSCPIPFDIEVAEEPACPGESNGSICVEAIPSDPTGISNLSFSFSWPSNVTSSNSGNTSCVNDIPNGQYSVTITEIGCGVSIVKNLALGYDSNINAYNPQILEACGNLPIGAIINTLTTGGKPPYSYQWSNGATSQSIANLAAGQYCLTITDACGSTFSDCYDVPSFAEDNVIDVDAEVVMDCYGAWGEPQGDPNGSIFLTVSGTAPPFSFLWNDGSTGTSRYNLPAGVYSVTITDNCGKSIIEEYEIEEIQFNPPFNVEIIKPCNDEDETGSIELNPNLNTNFEYEWSNGATTEDIYNLGIGSYSVTVTQGQTGCTKVLSYNISNESISEESVTGEVTSTCSSQDIGEITVSHPYGGNFGDYTYQWNNGVEGISSFGTFTIDNLSSGTYTVTITTPSGCTVEKSFDVELDDFRIELVNIDHLVGMIDIDVIGNLEPFTYEWSNGGSSQDIGNAGEGEHTVTVTDSRTCTQVETYAIYNCDGNNFNFDNITTEVIPLSEEGASDGSVTVHIDGITTGAGPLYYYWESPGNPNFPQSTVSWGPTYGLSNLPEGDYFVTVTNGCGSVESSWRPVRFCGTHDIDINGNVKDICPFPDCNVSLGSITLDISGDAIEPFELFKWRKGLTCTNNSPYANISSLTLEDLNVAAYYSVNVTDYANCSASACYQVNKTWEVQGPTWDRPKGICFVSLSCNGSCNQTQEEDLFLQNVTVNGSVCEGFLVCPIDGTMSPDLVQGQVYWSDVQPNVIGDDCHADRYCHFNIGDGIDVPIDPDTPVDCCPVDCDEFIDADCDCIPNEVDEAPNDPCVPNPSSDNCDTDGDGVSDSEDNCPTVANAGQEDTDGEGEAPGDGIGDACDNCQYYLNPEQEDIDNDGIGDICDNCPDDINSLQEDSDDDGVGDVCDNCPNSVNPAQSDCGDDDGIGDICDDEEIQDMDNDGVPDDCDICMDVFNPAQEGVNTDCDGNNVPDACEAGFSDIDGDGIDDSCDNCETVSNPSQIDCDNDGFGDICDDDGSPCSPNGTGGLTGPGGIDDRSATQDQPDSKEVRYNLNDKITLEVFPNPFRSDFSIRYYSVEKGNAHLYIKDIFGKIHVHKTLGVKHGQNQFLINPGNAIPDGILQVIVENSQGVQVAQKLIHISSN